MKIDIDNINRKMPYPEPSEAFFQKIQDNVVAKIVTEQSVNTKETKIFSLNFRWMVAASVVLIAGMTAFFGLQNDTETIEIAKQTNIIDSVYETDKPVKSLVADNSVTVKPTVEIKMKAKQYSIAAHISNNAVGKIQPKTDVDIQDYSVGKNGNSESAVDKILVAFTPEQIKDIDRNSEQDIYLDLYN